MSLQTRLQGSGDDDDLDTENINDFNPDSSENHQRLMHTDQMHLSTPAKRRQLVRKTSFNLYSQCFNYQNWTGTVKMPAALQYANKLAKFVGETTQKSVSSKNLIDSFYYL